MGKCYFITYQGSTRCGSKPIWNQVIDVSPMEFIKRIQAVEEAGSNSYYNFVVLNTCEISYDDFLKYDKEF